MKLNLIRCPVVGGQIMVAKFDVKGYRFLVKNHTDGDVYVSMYEGSAKNASILIPTQCAQIISANDGTCHATTDTIQIIPDKDSDKGVEVQCLRW